MSRPIKQVCQDIKQIIEDEVVGRDFNELLDVSILLNNLDYIVKKEMEAAR